MAHFTPIDMNTWPRGEHFHYFAHMAPTGYSLTAEVDVTRLRAALKGRGLKFYPAYLWLVTHSLNAREAFRLAEKDGVLGVYNTLPPENAYTVSCMPWVSFRHFAVHSYDSKAYYFPSVEAGRFEEWDGRTILPLSITCHHAATDGWHVKGFLEHLQREADSFEERLTGL